VATRDITSPQTGTRPSLGRRFVTETKAAFKTTEFWAMVIVIVGILICAAAINGGDNGTDEFIAKQAWLYVSIVTGAYLVSRGLAKSGSSDPYGSDSGQNRARNENGDSDGPRA
jgi:hypothetical protein